MISPQRLVSAAAKSANSCGVEGPHLKAERLELVLEHRRVDDLHQLLVEPVDHRLRRAGMVRARCQIELTRPG